MDYCIYYQRKPYVLISKELGSDYRKIEKKEFCLHPKHPWVTEEMQAIFPFTLPCNGLIEECPLSNEQLVDIF